MLCGSNMVHCNIFWVLVVLESIGKVGNKGQVQIYSALDTPTDDNDTTIERNCTAMFLSTFVIERIRKSVVYITLKETFEFFYKIIISILLNQCTVILQSAKFLV